MPFWFIPILLKGAAVFTGAVGVGAVVNGVENMKDAHDTMEGAKYHHECNMKKLDSEGKLAFEEMDKLGKLELEILDSFKKFSDVLEQIKKRSEFEEYSKNGVKLPKYDREEIKKVSVGAGVLLGGLEGAVLGTAGGFAAAGATTAAVTALGTASTGTAIASLSGVAATNATLALLGGGTLATGGGGMAAGAIALSAATFGVGLLVGGIIFSFTGEKLSDQADDAWRQMKKAEKQINEICEYFGQLRKTSEEYCKTLSKVNGMYQYYLNKLDFIVNRERIYDWNLFTFEEKLITKNTVDLVNLLYQMCKVELVLQSKNENETNHINSEKIQKSSEDANIVLKDISDNMWSDNMSDEMFNLEW